MFSKNSKANIQISSFKIGFNSNSSVAKVWISSYDVQWIISIGKKIRLSNSEFDLLAANVRGPARHSLCKLVQTKKKSNETAENILKKSMDHLALCAYGLKQSLEAWILKFKKKSFNDLWFNELQLIFGNSNVFCKA